MSNDADLWLRQFVYLFLLAALVQLLQAAAGLALWIRTASPVLLVFGLDALVGAAREASTARCVSSGRFPSGPVDHHPGSGAIDSPGQRSIPSRLPPAGGSVPDATAAGYILVGVLALGLGAAHLWQGRTPAPTWLGVGLAAISMLLVPIIGSYMKVLAVELKNPWLKAASVFTFGNSYLSLVLLIALLVNAGMERSWGDAAGALVMSPFIIQKGVGMLAEKAHPGSTGP